MKARHCGGRRVGFHMAFGLVVMTIVGVSKARGKVGEPCSFGFYEWLGSGGDVAVGGRGLC